MKAILRICIALIAAVSTGPVAADPTFGAFAYDQLRLTQSSGSLIDTDIVENWQSSTLLGIQPVTSLSIPSREILSVAQKASGIFYPAGTGLPTLVTVTLPGEPVGVSGSIDGGSLHGTAHSLGAYVYDTTTLALTGWPSYALSSVDLYELWSDQVTVTGPAGQPVSIAVTDHLSGNATIDNENPNERSVAYAQFDVGGGNGSHTSYTISDSGPTLINDSSTIIAYPGDVLNIEEQLVL